MLGSTYIFIDGGYLLRRHAETMRPWFGFEPDVDFRSAISGLAQLSGPPELWDSPSPDTRSFYYDCLDEDKRTNETDNQFIERLEKQNVRLRDLRDIDGCHIRLGALKGTRHRRQKEIDVLIAVDMMTHAARGNMTKAVLVAGDLDFRPAVEALVQFGISVQVISDVQNTSDELTWAASSFSKLNFEQFHSWTHPEQRRKNPLPRDFDYLPGSVEKLKDGSMKSDQCTLYSWQNDIVVHFPSFTSDFVKEQRAFVHESLEALELYFRIRYEPIVWKNQ